MNSKYQIFNSAKVELQRGVNLVEASAGTGKTYAIGMLVLRFVVEQEIPVDRILIVTFTKAATEELKSRIRGRLVEARNLLDQKVSQPDEKVDKTLLDWAATIKDHSIALNLLQLALYDIDRAGIFTIHGFCQRMLVEQALESGQFFDVELLADIDHVREQVAEDFWRTRIYPLDPIPCSLLTGLFPAPEKLLASVSEVFGGSGRIEPGGGSLDDILEQVAQAVEGLTSWWKKNSTDLYDYFVKSIAEGCFKKPFSEGFEPWFQSVADYLGGRSPAAPKNLQLLGSNGLAGELNGHKFRGDEKKQAFLAGWQLPDEKVELFLNSVDALVVTFRVQLGELLRTEVNHRLEQQGSMGFDDLILRLSGALKGDRSRYLKRVISERYTVSLIDEFQDTDSTQWHIFSTLFGGTGHYLYLIGDPKQAIYKFRGADIHSYFLARESADHLLTLDRNYRSHPFLVEEVNRLFTSRNNPFFFSEEVLDYRPVVAAKKEEDVGLKQSEESLAGMVYCVLEPESNDKKGRWSSGKAARGFRRFTAAEIGRLLDSSDPVFLQTDERRALAPHDIAVLVRSNSQAEEYRQTLSEAGIPAVVGSRQSVFQTVECQDLLLLLLSIASPGEMARLKTAMTISWFGFSGNKLHEFWQDEPQLSAYQGRFLMYNQLWQEQGFLIMMSRLLVEEEVLITLASGRMAERVIANIQHLLELVQEQEIAENIGIGQILQWLQRMMKDSTGAGNAELLLESDEEAVRIVTMHSAKGLEYPVVFCPYLWYGSKRVNSEKYQIRCHGDEHQVVVDLGSELFEARREESVKEQMAEDLRLLYVALTRAKIRCYTMWADVKPHTQVTDSFQSALGYLLFPDGYLDYQLQWAVISDFCRNGSVQQLTVPADETLVPYRGKTEQGKLHPLLPSGRSLRTDWQMSSFSAMASLSEYEQEHESDAAPDTGSLLVPVTGLPAGANFGNVIHDLLEYLSFSAIASQEDPKMQVELIKQKCNRYGVDADSAAVNRLLELVVETPLIAEKGGGMESFSLSMIPDSSNLKEMGFYFHLSRLATGRINDILADEPTVTPLGHKVMRGYLTGFVDLICEHEGRYYILDYKTNLLGEFMADYQQDKLVAAMHSHNYGLQYWIYTLILHRHLDNLLPDYRYESNFGGVMYLFLRGMSPQIPGSGVYATRPDFDKLVALDNALGGTRHG